MVAGPDYVFLCIPRVASVSVSRWLVDLHGGEILTPLYHSGKVPPEHRGKFTFATVRHPYTRMASLYRLLVEKFWSRSDYAQHKKDTRKGPPPHMTFCEFLEWCVEEENKGVGYKLQSEIVDECSSSVHVVKFENLSALDRLPFVRTRFNTEYYDLNKTKPVPKLLTIPARALINEQSREDFEMFRYGTW